jgi:hypothetical protein
MEAFPHAPIFTGRSAEISVNNAGGGRICGGNRYPNPGGRADGALPVVAQSSCGAMSLAKAVHRVANRPNEKPPGWYLESFRSIPATTIDIRSYPLLLQSNMRLSGWHNVPPMGK